LNYNWNIRRLTAQEEALQQQLERELNISAAAARMLVVRNIQSAEEARAFIRPSLDKLHDPFLMKDMDKAVERLHQALTQNENILIYGDYDVDGTTAVAVMYRFLSPLTSRLDYYIPDRHNEGYGVSQQGIDYAAERGCTLIITLD
jgi:single-stranded-DNA-specific exonuclease